MSSVQSEYVPPTTDETAFNCPHCGAFALQTWFTVGASPKEKDKLPKLVSKVRKRGSYSPPSPYLGANDGYMVRYELYNVWVSLCYGCDDIAIWICNRLVWPQRGEGPLPNPDLPADVRRDYDEASVILDLSPRGAAALLRLAIQKLCKHLGEKGKNLNDDIESLVKKGLDPIVQQSLDAVRVIGNNAVHPGELDLKDDRVLAASLFGLVNIIAQTMITRPKQVQAVYDSLSQGAKDQIAKRDGQKT